MENKSEPPYQQNMGGVKRFLKISCFKRKKQATPCVSPIFSISGFPPLYFNGSAILQQMKKKTAAVRGPPGVPAEEACRKGFLIEKTGQTTGQVAKADRSTRIDYTFAFEGLWSRDMEPGGASGRRAKRSDRRGYSLHGGQPKHCLLMCR